jgi:hypothetical protein
LAVAAAAAAAEQSRTSGNRGGFRVASSLAAAVATPSAFNSQSGSSGYHFLFILLCPYSLCVLFCVIALKKNT